MFNMCFIQPLIKKVNQVCIRYILWRLNAQLLNEKCFASYLLLDYLRLNHLNKHQERTCKRAIFVIFAPSIYDENVNKKVILSVFSAISINKCLINSTCFRTEIQTVFQVPKTYVTVPIYYARNKGNFDKITIAKEATLHKRVLVKF